MAIVKKATVEWDKDTGVFFVRVAYSTGTYTHCYEDDKGVLFYKEQALAEVYADEILVREYDDNISSYDPSPYIY